ncbi:MAG: NAD(P)/FAD-dependent oxidoreductase [Deltaproteobacteria bacterium]|nr:NAD(P)/FAD-dependent oxidoreductase [Deltaproteobacteria bacterium]
MAGARDLLIIGGGPAGLSAALIAHGNGLDTLLLEAGEQLGGQLRRADHPITDYLGVEAESGAALAARFQEHVVAAHVPLRLGARVARIELERSDLCAILTEGERILARRILIASGTRARRLGIVGEDTLGAFEPARTLAASLAGESVVIAGTGDEACSNALVLAEHGVHVTIVGRSPVLRARGMFARWVAGEPRIETRLGEQIVALEGEEALRAVVLRSGGRILARRLFVRIGVEITLPEIDPPIALHPDGRVMADAVGRTSVPGLFAAGDVVAEGPRRYAAIACGMGVAAARAIEGELFP